MHVAEVLQTNLAWFFFPTSTVGISGNFCFYWQSDKNNK
jgi:hypothetical protein